MGASTHAKGRATGAFEHMAHTAGGNLICQVAHHSISAAISNDDVFQMIKVPKGAVIVGGWIALDSSSTGTFTVGDAADTNRHLGTASVSLSNTIHHFGGNVLGITTGMGHKYSAEDTIDVKFSAVGSAGSSLDWTLCVFYLMESTGATGGAVV